MQSKHTKSTEKLGKTWQPFKKRFQKKKGFEIDHHNCKKRLGCDCEMTFFNPEKEQKQPNIMTR